MLGQIADEYRKLLDSHRGIEQAEVTTAVPLDEGEIKKLEEDLGALVGKNVVIRPEVDPALMGGITARVGGKLIDGSTRSRLERLKKQIGGERR
jgi:F-type H+-transporting ATPase subunit delta